MARAPIRLVSETARQMTELIRRDARERGLGTDATFEQRRDAAAALTSDALWLDADLDLREAITTAAEVEVDGRCYAALDQPSSATYYSRWAVTRSMRRFTAGSARAMARRSNRSRCASG